MNFEIGQAYTRAEIFKRLIGEEVPTKGRRSVGVVREGQYVLAFANVGVAGRTGHNFPNEFDEENKLMAWFGQPGAHSGWRDMRDIIDGSASLLMFTRSADRLPFQFRGQADVLGYEDGVSVTARDKVVQTIRFKFGFNRSGDFLGASTEETDAGSGQGTGLNADERRAVEFQAMGEAKAHFEAHGYHVTDVSNDRLSYDLHASRGDDELVVEVKGTTGEGDAVIMTGNEVRLLRLRYPNTSLVVVSKIKLDRTGASPKASGGVMREYRGIDLADRNLTPTEYRVALRHLSK